MITISGLFVYPIKSLAGISITAETLTDRGFQHDRRWMLINENNKFISQREYSELCLLKTIISNDYLEVSHAQNPQLHLLIPLQVAPKEKLQVQIWDDICHAWWLGNSYDEWFSSILKIKCRLVYMPEETHRYVDDRFANDKQITAFSDGFPLSLIGNSSLIDLNNKMKLNYKMDRFRPNIVIDGSAPFEEDTWKEFTINDILFSCVKPLARCPITTIDQQTASKSKEPLHTLSKYRFANNKVYFGQNLLYNKSGILSIGDEIIINQIQKPVL